MVRPKTHPWKPLLALAALYPLLNAPKPLLIDDAAYHAYAAHIARQPLDPYGFEMFWWQHPEPANYILAPPLLPYWWAAAIRLFGERPFLWKLGLLPFSLLFIFSLHALFRRFCRGLEVLLVTMTVLSPTFLPSLNLMLDVPALALSLMAITLFLRACDRGSFALAAGAGLIAGLAMETKYTGFLAPAVMLLYGVVFGKLRFAAVAGLVAAQLFASWELLIALLSGESHFLLHLRDHEDDLLRRGHLITPLFTILGAVAPAGLLFSLATLLVPRRYVFLAGLLVLAGFFSVAVVEASFPIHITFHDWFTGLSEDAAADIYWHHIVYGLFGAGVCGAAAVVGWRLCRLSCRSLTGLCHWRRYRAEWFLVFWLALEVLGYFALTPFPAVRRLMGVVVVGSLVAGRLASLTCRSTERRATLRGVAAFGILLALGFYGIDLRDAFTGPWGAESAARYVREREPGATVWYVGHWGFQYYAERAGMKPVVPDDSRLAAGDWLVVPDPRHNQQLVRTDVPELEAIDELTLTDWLPFHTIMPYYGGDTPLERHEGPRITVTIYRVRRDVILRSPWRAAAHGPPPVGWEGFSTLVAHCLDQHAPRARAVELAEIDALPAAQHQVAVLDHQLHARADQARLKVRITVALRMAEPGLLLRDRPVQPQ